MVVVDVETGGLDHTKHALLSLAAVDSDGEAFHALIRPSAEWLIDPVALEINGFSVEYLQEFGRPEVEVLKEFILWLASRRGAMVAGCAVDFDVAFLRAAAKRCGLELVFGRTLDLRGAAWLAYELGKVSLPLGKDGNPRLSLDSISQSMGMSRAGDRHDCLEDALLTMSCFKTLLYV